MCACRIRVLVSAVWALLVLGACRGQGETTEDRCNNFDESCNACIAAAPECVWCSFDPNQLSGSRCRNEQEWLGGQCPEQLIQNPPSTFTVDMNANFSDETLVQIRPQEISARLRPGKPVSFNVSVNPAANYPLDLYLLLDLSASLQDDLATLRSVSRDLVDTIKTISPASQLGFGTFVDKDALPFSLDTYKSNRTAGAPAAAACVNFRPPCLDPYAYRHLLSLTEDAQAFNDILGLSFVDISASIDSPEGGLDALAQIAACDDIIGWRENALRLVLLMTDNTYHVAGDGRLGGILRPYDGQCHLETTNIEGTDLFQYNANTEFDYPSIYQLNQILTGRERLIIPIFAVTSERVESYEDLASNLDSALVTELARDSSNIIQLIQDTYNSISQLVGLNPVTTVPELEFNIEPIEGCDTRTEDNCAGIQFTETVVFNVTVTLTQCPTDQSSIDDLQNVVLSSSFGRIRLNIEPVCSCDCEEEADFTRLDGECSDNGTLVCGGCDCQVGRFGARCQCDRPTNPTCPIGLENKECSGRGSCDQCSECDCDLQEGLFPMNYFGEACQCSNSTCAQNPISTSPFYQQLCSGETRGECNCDTGLCECKIAPKSGKKFFGGACQCDPDVCFDPEHPTVDCYAGEGILNGTCGCNFCNCPSNFIADILAGTCQAVRTICDENRGCARCAKNVRTDQNCSACDTVIVDDQDEAEGLAGVGVARCTFDDGDCVHTYYVAASGPVYVERGEDCGSGDDNLPWIIAVSIIAALLVLGVLALILIKLILVAIDRVEYRKFTKQLEEADWGSHENPLYLNPQQDYMNVAYRGGRKCTTKLQ